MYINYNIISQKDLNDIIESGKLEKAKNNKFATKN